MCNVQVYMCTFSGTHGDTCSTVVGHIIARKYRHRDTCTLLSLPLYKRKEEEVIIYKGIGKYVYMCPRKKGGSKMANVNQVMRRIQEVESVVEELRKPLEAMGEIDREEIADWLVDYQQMLLRAEVKL